MKNRKKQAKVLDVGNTGLLLYFDIAITAQTDTHTTNSLMV